MAGFDYKYSLTGSELPLLSKIIGNSVTLTIGDFVRPSSGFLALGALGNRLLGQVTGFRDRNGLPLDHPSADFDGTYTTGGLGTGTYVATSDNQTDKQVVALVRFDPFAVYYNTPDATIGTTTGSNLLGYYTDILAASDQVDESSAVTTPAQLFILGLDPDNSAKGLYMIAEHVLFNVSTLS